jgi:hypothetical protein
MAERPPGDGDDLWTEVIEQVTDALNDSDIDLGLTRDALIDGVRQALESLSDGIDVQFDVMTTTEGVANDAAAGVSVVEGGRSDSDPPTPGDKPNLRVAAPTVGDDDDGMVAPPSNVVTKVKVLRTAPRSVSVQQVTDTVPGLGVAGWINVVGGDGADSAWQTIYQGRVARVYRVACTRGMLDVTRDGEPVERLRAGQSIDVEGCLVRVSAAEDESAKGGYAQVQPVVVGEE